MHEEVAAVTQQQQSGYFMNSQRKPRFNNQWHYCGAVSSIIDHSEVGKKGK